MDDELIEEEINDGIDDEFLEEDISDEPLESQELGQEDSSQKSTDFIDAFLKQKGIEDKTKIKFEDEDGTIQEYNWDTLDNQEKLNILNTDNEDPDTDLDDTEIELLNAIRSSGLTPQEYLQKIQNDSVNNYIQNSEAQQYHYEVDQLSDDELFIYDFISRMGDVTEQEAQEALANAKANESLFAKQIGAIRKEYKEAENESIRQAQMEEEVQAQERYDQFANQIAEQVDSLSDFSGYDLNMDDEDKEMLYEFIVGVDGAGNNYFAKALSDPKVLVKTAWLALNGEQMIHDITEYFQKEISSVRKESYDKGKADAQKKDKSNMVYKNKPVESFNEVYDDLD